ncbi:MAG: CRISPR-associated protein Cas4 [Chloroflexi bacterium]|nr:CRISPR-associated protein Cas4 [Chloroflexota bacterium]
MDASAAREPFPLSLLNDHLYCPRRAALKVVEGWRSGNQHTAQGDIVHEHADRAGYEVSDGVKVLRALPVWSERLGLNGKCDLVEQRPDGSLFPVEVKVGRRWQWTNDDVQLCAQALCLEEMFLVTVGHGAIFHATSKRRREVEFTPLLRKATEVAVLQVRTLLTATHVPPAVFTPACVTCSLFEICLPRATSSDGHAVRLARAVFTTE